MWLCMSSILENIPCALEKNVCSTVLGCNVLYISTKFTWSNISFKATVSLLIVYLNDLSIDVSYAFSIFLNNRGQVYHFLVKHIILSYKR